MEEIIGDKMESNEIIVYSAKLCSHCLTLKEFLQSNHIRFEEKNMGAAECLTELRVNGCFTMEAPVLRIGDQLFTSKQLFEGEEISEEIVTMLLSYTKFGN
jgi:hypothetical protein